MMVPLYLMTDGDGVHQGLYYIKMWVNKSYEGKQTPSRNGINTINDVGNNEKVTDQKLK